MLGSPIISIHFSCVYMNLSTGEIRVGVFLCPARRGGSCESDLRTSARVVSFNSVSFVLALNNC